MPDIMEMQARPGSARASIIALRKAAPTAWPWALFREYEMTPGNKPIGWPYFIAVIIEIDKFERWKREKRDA